MVIGSCAVSELRLLFLYICTWRLLTWQETRLDLASPEKIKFSFPHSKQQRLSTLTGGSLFIQFFFSGLVNYSCFCEQLPSIRSRFLIITTSKRRDSSTKGGINLSNIAKKTPSRNWRHSSLGNRLILSEGKFQKINKDSSKFPENVGVLRNPNKSADAIWKLEK
jgi:hypothetical protein